MSAKMIALVTGGAGFIGSHMVDLLVKEGFQVRIIDNLKGGCEQNLKDHSHNKDVVLDTRNVQDIPPNDAIFKDLNYIFHFAGIGDIVPSIEQPAEYLLTNVQGTVAALEGARAANVNKFVYAASSSCYGLAQTPTKEDHPINPQYPYALSKYMGEQAALHWHQVYHLPVNSIRIFNAYGTRSRTSGAYGAVFGVFLKQKLANKPFTVVGDGTQKRDFLYVTDVVIAFYAAAQTADTGEIYNLGSNNPQSVNHLVELLKGEVVYIPKRPGEPDCTWADTTKINSQLDWSPSISFEEGVAKILDQIDSWKDAPLWDTESISHATKIWFEMLDHKGAA